MISYEFVKEVSICIWDDVGMTFCMMENKDLLWVCGRSEDLQLKWCGMAHCIMENNFTDSSHSKLKYQNIGHQKVVSPLSHAPKGSFITFGQYFWRKALLSHPVPWWLLTKMHTYNQLITESEEKALFNLQWSSAALKYKSKKDNVSHINLVGSHDSWFSSFHLLPTKRLRCSCLFIFKVLKNRVFKVFFFFCWDWSSHQIPLRECVCVCFNFQAGLQ